MDRGSVETTDWPAAGAGYLESVHAGSRDWPFFGVGDWTLPFFALHSPLNCGEGARGEKKYGRAQEKGVRLVIRKAVAGERMGDGKWQMAKRVNATSDKARCNVREERVEEPEMLQRALAHGR